ncbi:PhoH-like phosphate starvation-inducible protein [Synechococcus sp. RS9916]|nr:PhoH-like phosphate starvation-inducible protein [Synechococcus sp. RS9916]
MEHQGQGNHVRAIQPLECIDGFGVNTTPAQMRMVLTRLGERSRMVVTGDITQVDLPAGQLSGLVEAAQVLEGVEGVAVCKLTSADVVRHPLVQRVVEAYAKRDKANGGPPSTAPRSRRT